MKADTEIPIKSNRIVPLTVLTGFLGAGKTTLLNRILNGKHGLRVAVLVNDFGSVNIDAELVVGVEDDLVSLANGCVCCSIRDDLVEAVARVLERPEWPEYVLLEASGVADPAGIAATFMDPHFHESVRLDSITTVVDAEQLFAVPELMQLKLWQVGCADLLILNKVDLVSRADVARIKEWLDKHFHRYRLIEATHCDVPLEILLSAGRFDAHQVETNRHEESGHTCDCPGDQPGHAHTFGTWSYSTDQPMSLQALRETAARLPVNIYRCKGVIHSADAPNQRAVLQVVGKRVNLALESDWGDRSPRTQIVAIGSLGSIDGCLLEQKFSACIARAIDQATPVVQFRAHSPSGLNQI